MTYRSTPPPRDGIVRARPGAVELRAAEEDESPTLTGHFAVFNEYTEINSAFEGHFMERIAPGAFAKTLKDQRSDIKVLFQHGHDPAIADKPLGKIRALEEDEVGVRYEVEMLRTAYNEELIPGLEAGLYGASFRFRSIREQFDKEPEESDHNPEGIPERTIEELQLYEFGPVTFPAYANATAGVRSLTDEEILCRMAEDPERLRDLLTFASPEADPEPAKTTPEDEPPSAESAHAPQQRVVTTSMSSKAFWASLRESKKWNLT